MTLNKAIKFNAKKCLKNNWGRAILIFVIMAAVSAVLGALDNAIFSAFGFHRVEISIDLLRGGYMEWWLAEGADVTWYEVAIPTAMMAIGAANLWENRSLGVPLVVIGSVLMLVALPFTWWFGARYMAANLLLCDRYYYTVKEATRLSVALTRGRRWQIVGFYLSFLPWYLLCCLVLPLLYVIPYVAVAGTMMARYLFEDYLLGQKKLDVSDPDQLIIDDVAPEDYHKAREEQGMEAPAPAEEPFTAPEEASEEDNGGIAEL